MIATAVAALGFAALLGAQTATAPAAQAPEWKTYSYPADGFSASLPLEPIVQKKDVPTEKGSFEMHVYMMQETDSALVVMACDYGDAIAGRDADSILHGAQEGAISNVRGHLIREKKLPWAPIRGSSSRQRTTRRTSPRESSWQTRRFTRR